MCHEYEPTDSLLLHSVARPWHLLHVAAVEERVYLPAMGTIALSGLMRVSHPSSYDLPPALRTFPHTERCRGFESSGVESIGLSPMAVGASSLLISVE